MALSQDQGAVSCCPEDERLLLAKTFAFRFFRPLKLSPVEQLDAISPQLTIR
ncbi:Uncharacterised protein [Serratia quinivorans]|uniref:hypothetical protein n=1 Tax=Serratia quinivorans TaxID=137545 RepID=UPI00217C1E3F|nr:hypothetical protein [Serratia quinivorans]CAI1858969.1 Uncharacterised protein [Serratia quinivorans]